MSQESINSQEVIEDQNVVIKSMKTITFLFAFSLVYGNIVGCGIFISVKSTLEVFTSDAIGMVVLFWLVSGIISIFGGLCYAELGTRIPKSGGERAYFKEIIGEKLSKTFVIGYAFILKPLTMAALSIIVGKYTLAIFDGNKSIEWLEKILAIGFVILCFILNCISKVIANRMGVILTILKTLALLIIIGCGIYYLCIGNINEWKEPFKMEGGQISKFGICLVNLFWAYEGWNTLGLIAGDMKNPSRDLPKAIILGLIAVIILYILTVISYVSVLGYSTVRTIETVAITLSQEVLKGAYFIVPILICCSGLGALNGNMYSISCICVSAGQSGEIPKIFSLISKKQRTGIFSLLILALISCAFIPFPFQALLGYSSFISWVFYFISMICLWIVKINKSKYKQSSTFFNVPYSLIIIMQIFCLAVIILCFYNQPLGTCVFSIILLIIFFIQFIPSRYTNIKIFSSCHSSLISLLKRKLNLDEATESDVS